MTVADPTKRFSDRVENYIKYRPSYPAEVLDYLAGQCDLANGSTIADVGSGTGIFSALLLARGYKVFAVEPNESMQGAAISQFGGNDNFIPVASTAETTSLPSDSIDLVVCAQAFHWFDAEKTKTEFKRILKDQGQVALIWNNRDAGTDEFSAAYENLLKQDSVDYNNVNHRNISDMNFKAFFKGGLYEAEKYPNVQVFDEEGLLGRAFSSSYVPAEDTYEGKKFKDLLKALFAKYNKDGKVRFYYQTEVYLGKV
ncbi:MAG TPA: methyltransferase domain-containing protein [Mucilaginibacter sp.]|jgi:SAM-dependent methyltransferase|nr:methyltransferase domain-containing protein [Mucilaginibacter sp.]